MAMAETAKSFVRPSDRSAIAPFHVMEVFEAAERRAATGAEVVRLEVGQPETPAPAGVIAEAHRQLDEDVIGYGSVHGIPELRHRLAAHYRDWYELDIDPARFVVTVGASGAFTMAFLAAFNPGDRVAVTIPGYPCYRNALEALGAEVVPVMTGFEHGFQPTVELLEAVGPIDGLVITSPSNPAGTMIDAERLAAITAWCRDNETILISDEIYHGLTYGDPAVTALSFDDNAIVVNSFSKYFSMTGWRLGWLVVPKSFIGPVTRFAANLLLGAQTLSQLAGVAAFDCHDELQSHLHRYRENRSILLDGLPRAGIDKLAPADGAFYVYADVSHLCDDSQELSRIWLDELGIATTPGIDFDPYEGHRYIRFSFYGATADMHRCVGLLTSRYA